MPRDERHMGAVERERVMEYYPSYAALADSRRGTGWYKYQKGNRMVWLCADGWQTADMVEVDGVLCYVGHKLFKSLLGALARPTRDEVIEAVVQETVDDMSTGDLMEYAVTKMIEYYKSDDCLSEELADVLEQGGY